MGDRAVLHVRNSNDTATFFTLYTHGGGDPLYMLSKVATFLSECPSHTPTDFAAYFLTRQDDYHLELMEAGSEPGDCEHIYTLRWDTSERDEQWRPVKRLIVTVKPSGINEGRLQRTWPTTWTGDAEVFTEAATRLRAFADRIEQVQAEQGWDRATTERILGSAALVRDEADAFEACASAAANGWVAA